jgi:hypothetical protein
MFDGTTAAIRMIAVLAIVLVGAVGIWYVTELTADGIVGPKTLAKLLS